MWEINTNKEYILRVPTLRNLYLLNNENFSNKKIFLLHIVQDKNFSQILNNHRSAKYHFGSGNSREMDFTDNADDFVVNAAYILVAVNSKIFTIWLWCANAPLFLHYDNHRWTLVASVMALAICNGSNVHCITQSYSIKGW